MRLERLYFLGRVSWEKLSFLYDLLAEREAHQNISHRKMPSYNAHVDFVRAKPYFAWNIIVHDGERVGSIYMTHDSEIGIQISKRMLGTGIGSDALKAFMKKYPRKRYLANINPANVQSIEFFERHGFKLLQQTYELEA